MIKQIPILKIVKEPLFLFSFRRNNSSLFDSIKRFGLLEPVHLWSKNSEFHVIDGVQRIESARQLGFTEITAVIDDEVQVSQAHAFLIGLESNRWSRKFNSIEKGLILKQSAELFDEQGMNEQVYPSLEINNDHQARSFLRLLELPEVIQFAMIDNNWSVASVNNFLKFPSDQQESIFRFLDRFKINQNKLLEILEWLFDLSQRDQVSAIDVLKEIDVSLEPVIPAEAGIQACPCEGREPLNHLDSRPPIVVEGKLRGNDNRGGKNKTGSTMDTVTHFEKIRTNLRKTRFFYFEKKKEEFNQALDQLKLSKNIQVQPSPYFEEGFVELKIRMSSQDDQKKIKEQLEKGEWKNIFDLME